MRALTERERWRAVPKRHFRLRKRKHSRSTGLSLDRGSSFESFRKQASPLKKSFGENTWTLPLLRGKKSTVTFLPRAFCEAPHGRKMRAGRPGKVARSGDSRHYHPQGGGGGGGTPSRITGHKGHHCRRPEGQCCREKGANSMKPPAGTSPEGEGATAGSSRGRRRCGRRGKSGCS